MASVHQCLGPITCGRIRRLSKTISEIQPPCALVNRLPLFMRALSSWSYQVPFPLSPRRSSQLLNMIDVLDQNIAQFHLHHYIVYFDSSEWPFPPPSSFSYRKRTHLITRSDTERTMARYHSTTKATEIRYGSEKPFTYRTMRFHLPCFGITQSQTLLKHHKTLCNPLNH